MKLQFATSSNEKFREACAILSDLVRIKIELPEIQSVDLQEIVRAKLAYAVKSGLDNVLVEDTGLELECLGGLPGPFIKYFEKRLGSAGLFEIADKLGKFGAKSITVAACSCAGKEFIATGMVEGKLVAPRGGPGFGFDPIFLPNGHTETFAQMGAEKKAMISHRALAMRNLRSMLDQAIGN